MKLLVVCSSLDLRAPLSSTPSWWQLLKALAEAGVELVATPYHGPAIESPWWSAAPNPCQREGDAVALAKRLARGLGRAPATARTAGESPADRLVRALANGVTKPKWRRHLAGLLERHPDTDALLWLTVPPNQLVGIPTALRQRYGVPSYFYDGDVPASLPRFAGFQSGFKIYPGADLAEYQAFFSNSRGGVEDLKRLGARQVHVLHYAADPALFSRVAVEEDLDVFFYGHGAEYREEWMEALLAGPSRAMPEARFAARGTRLGELGRVALLPYLSFSKLREYCCRSRVNVAITRRAHASVYASSTARPFELAALGCAMVSNPYLGVEEWFEPGQEILVVKDAREAIETYRWLLRDHAARRELGARARARFLAQHTYRHRAEELLSALSATARDGA
ncbi:MAG: glycosyltransferase [Chloroflexi bacterium]|nr:glycosyltransferase [Chloroflexota bacterium]